MVTEMNIKQIERGWAGHFICADRCRFHRNTLLECGDVRIIVSTVGYYRPNGTDIETVGGGRYYETMAFHAEFVQATYWDANVSANVSFTSPWMIDTCDNAADACANVVHEHVVAEIVERIRRGEYNECH